MCSAWKEILGKLGASRITKERKDKVVYSERKDRVVYSEGFCKLRTVLRKRCHKPGGKTLVRPHLLLAWACVSLSPCAANISVGLGGVQPKWVQPDFDGFSRSLPDLDRFCWILTDFAGK